LILPRNINFLLAITNQSFLDHFLDCAPGLSHINHVAIGAREPACLILPIQLMEGLPLIHRRLKSLSFQGADILVML
jgi:hypothetical protein